MSLLINFRFLDNSIIFKLKLILVVCYFATNSISSATAQKTISFSESSKNVQLQQGCFTSLLSFISTSDNVPASVTLSAVDQSGNVPLWLTVNQSPLTSTKYTANSEISLDVNATNLPAGSYSATITASASGYISGIVKTNLTVTASSLEIGPGLKINFQDSSLTIPPNGWLSDYGEPYGPRNSSYQGNGRVYGWLKRSDRTPLDLTLNTRLRSKPADNILLATLNHMQGQDVTNFSGTTIEGFWELLINNGNYEVTVTAGDDTRFDSRHCINVEGIAAISNFTPSTDHFKTGTVIVSVSDNLLTIDARGGLNTKINYIIIKPYNGIRPSVVSVNPEDGKFNISGNTSISTAVLKLPNSGINNTTITTESVYLTEEATGVKIPANVNGTGGGDAITLVPSSLLKSKTAYRFTITSGVKDQNDSSFIPYSSTFTAGTTATASSGDTATIRFNKIAQLNATGQHSSLTIGPDGKLYALTIDGIIKRFVINADGSLGVPQNIYSIQRLGGTQEERLAVGLAFDPTSTATNLIAYVTHSTFVFNDGPAYDGKLTKLWGLNLEKAVNLVVNLPRATRDHLTNSIAFGPDKALYFTQGSMSAMGRADNTWGNREEQLLSAAVLRLDLSKLFNPPLDAKTKEGNGVYNPYATNAPLTIYASGVRNAYDLLWHSNGQLYVPTNGSAAGGNTPASVAGTLRINGTTYTGPVIRALTNIQQTQKDYLFSVVKGGYYGHPNALRGEYVMNGGNPTSAADPAQVSAYPLGTAPDANWKGFAFDFDVNKSPNGVIEYKSNTFNGALRGKILVVRYSQKDDIICLTPGGTNKNIISSEEGASIPGFTGFVDPLDLVEDVRNGNIYVSEYGGSGKIVLLKPATATGSARTIAEDSLANVLSRTTKVTKSKNKKDKEKSHHYHPGCDELPDENKAKKAHKNDNKKKAESNNPPVIKNSQSSIHAYPNPAHNKFNIKFPSTYEGDFTIQLLDPTGKTYDLGKKRLKTGGTDLSFDISKNAMKAGIYFLKVFSKTHSETVKLIIK